MDVKISDSWKAKLQNQFDMPYFEALTRFVKAEYQTQRIFPPGHQIFNAFDQCSWEETRVVILGQDPYHGLGQAHGLCFSVNDGVRKPPSLLNIFKEIKKEIAQEVPVSGNLTRWANQGVLLLNTILTVRESTPLSHQNQGWETLTDEVISLISKEKEHVVFLLWGSSARRKVTLIDANRHLILESAHPSPMSVERGFFGNNHFIKTNDYLRAHGLKPIEW